MHLKPEINLLGCKGGLKGCKTLLQVHPSLHDVTSVLKLANRQWTHNRSLFTQAHAHKKLIFICNLLLRKMLAKLLFLLNSAVSRQPWTGEIPLQTSLKERFFCSS